MSRLIHPLLALLALAMPAFAQGEPLDAALTDVRAMVESAPGDLGLVVAVTDRDRLRLVATHGYADIKRREPVTADTRFAIGSISKSFTAIALMQMADEGRFDPDAPIARYLPDFHPRSKFPPITGHALLTHTSGLPGYLANLASMRFLIAALGDFEPPYAPGAHFWYSNTGFQLLGYAAERIDGQPFPLILRRRVLDRLGMAATSAQIDDRLRDRMATSYVRLPDGSYAEAPWFAYLASDGAVVSTGADMSAYARMLLARGATPKGRLISARAFDRFATPVLDGYAYGIDTKEDGRVLAHGGSIAGFQAYLEAHPAAGFAVTFLSNGPIDQSLRDRITARLAGRQPPSRKADVSADPAIFAGRFVNKAGEALTFTADTSGLSLGDTRLARLGGDVWGLYLTPHGPRAFQFFRDAAGAVTEVVEGTTTYVKAGAALPAVETPAAYRALVGRYATHGEEGPAVRILARGGRLMMAYADASGDVLSLDEAGPLRFRFAEPAFAPETLAFDTMIDGQAQRLTLSGVPLYRIDLP